MAAHTDFVPDVTQPWLSDGDHAKARSPSLSAVATWLPLAMRETRPVALLTLERELAAF